MSDKINVLRVLYENSKLEFDKDIFDEIIKAASLQGIETSIRSLKSYKKIHEWKNTERERIATEKKNAPPPLPPKPKEKNNLLKVVKPPKPPKEPKPPKAPKVKTVKPEPPPDPIEILTPDPLNPVAYQQKLTEVMQFLLQGASKAKIYDHYLQKGEKISRENIDKLANEAYNIYATISPQQRETILGINYERLNMLFHKVVSEMGKNSKSTGYLAGQAVRIMSEINSMFGIKSINLNVNNMDGIQNKINNMTDEEKLQRLMELTKKEDGTYGV